MRGIEARLRAAAQRPTAPSGGRFCSVSMIDNEEVFGRHKARDTSVAAPTRRSGTTRLLNRAPNDRNRPRAANTAPA